MIVKFDVVCFIRCPVYLGHILDLKLDTLRPPKELGQSNCDTLDSDMGFTSK